jgi:uncharacterized protein (DUF58 family)
MGDPSEPSGDRRAASAVGAASTASTASGAKRPLRSARGDKPPPAPVPPELMRQLRGIEIRTRHLANEQLSGNYHSVFKGQGLSFREVRAYQPGDDPRFIDWNVSARMSDAFVKVFTEEREMTVMLVVDLSQSEQFGTRRVSKARLAAEICALCAFSAIKNNDRVGLVLATDVIERLLPPKKGEKHVMRVVREILGHVPEYSGTNLRLALETLVHVSKRRSVAFVVSDFFASGFERALSLASARHDVIPVMLTDPRDDDLPDVGLATFEDFETGESLVVDTSDRRVRDHYARAMKDVRLERQRLFRKLSLDAVAIRTDESVVAPLRQLFARRARRLRR